MLAKLFVATSGMAPSSNASIVLSPLKQFWAINSAVFSYGFNFNAIERSFSESMSVKKGGSSSFLLAASFLVAPKER